MMKFPPFSGFEPPAGQPKPVSHKLSIEVMAAIEIFVTNYRKFHQLRFDETLTHKQISDICEDIKAVIYKKEGLNKPSV